MSKIDWTKIHKQYAGLWITLKEDEKTVISSGKVLKQVLGVAEEKGYHNPLLLRVPDEVVTFVG